MVSIREIERKIKQNNSNIQWEKSAKLRLGKHMELLMTYFIKEVEENRAENKRRITTQAVDNTCINILHILNSGEHKNG